MASPQPTGSPQNEDTVFSIRIVSIDYYMTPPIPDYDICYSSFHGGVVEKVPVIRIYGSTLAGQKTCLHVHRALPYLYVPCSDIGLQITGRGEGYLHDVFLAVEKALSGKSFLGSKKQHVHGCSFFRAKRLYGYHSSEELFVKIYLYYPNDVSRASALLLGCAVLDRVIQPYESHIPFLLQFLVSDTEGVRLLNWLASSQAVDEINSDDELGCEVILSPLFPTKSHDKLLEKAQLDYETISQRECQDILDTIEDTKLENFNHGKALFSGSEYVSSDSVIPQLDGSCDGEVESPMGKECETNITSKSAVDDTRDGRNNLKKNADQYKRSTFMGTLTAFL